MPEQGAKATGETRKAQMQALEQKQGTMADKLGCGRGQKRSGAVCSGKYVNVEPLNVVEQVSV